MKKTIGAITIGQSPRVDVVPEMQALLGQDVEVLQAGVLDGLSAKEIDLLAPAGNGDAEIARLRGESSILVSRLRDGSWVSMEEGKILPLMQERICGLEAQGVSLIVMLCTGKFPDQFRSEVTLVFPQKLLYGIVPQLASRIGILSPDVRQLPNSMQKWGSVARHVIAANANPYENAAGLEVAAEKFLEDRVQLCVMDCIGYNCQMKQRLEELTGLPVILPRTLVARVISEMLE